MVIFLPPPKRRDEVEAHGGCAPWPVLIQKTSSGRADDTGTESSAFIASQPESFFSLGISEKFTHTFSQPLIDGVPFFFLAAASALGFI